MNVTEITSTDLWDTLSKRVGQKSILEVFGKTKYTIAYLDHKGEEWKETFSVS